MDLHPQRSDSQPVTECSHLASVPEMVKEVSHAQNFTILDFFESEDPSLKGRVAPFADYLQSVVSDLGYHPYGRAISGPLGPTVQSSDMEGGALRETIMLGANNYLGTTSHPKIVNKVLAAIKESGIGVGGPALLNGMSQSHRDLQARLAKLKSKEATMLFGSGYQANLGWISGLIRTGDVLVYDELSHASSLDGIQLAKARADFRSLKFKHNDAKHLENSSKEFGKTNDMQTAKFL